MTLTCTAKGNPGPTFEWLRDAHLETGPFILKYANVFSDPPTVEVRSSWTKFNQGEAMTLLCQVKRGNPWPDSFMWHKDDKLVASRRNLMVSSVQPEDIGRYTCTAFNAGFKDMKATSAELLVDVEYRPRETSLSIMGSTSPMVKAGASALLRCAADANPKPDEYDWSLLSQDGRTWDKLSNGNEEHLLVREVRLSDRRCYACRAINQVGFGENSPPLCIQVMYRPTNLLLSVPDTVTEGDLVSVRCSVESLPLSNMTLTKTSVDRSSVRSVTNQLDMRVQYNLLTFGFVATWDDAGVYTCTAANSEGSASAQKTLEVTYASRNVLVKADPSLVVAKSTSLTLRCVADWNPPIRSVTWWKAGQIVNQGPTLTLSSVALADAGVYACTAGNELGSARSAPVEVTVHDGPSEPVLCMTTKVTEGERVNMLCSVESDPLSTLTLTRQSAAWSPAWPGASSHGNAVQNNTLSHTFKATWADGGVYTCEADNGLGRRRTHKTLKVTYAPKNVTVRAQPSLVVTENATVTLQCDADSDPPVESVTWWKVNGTRSRNLTRSHNLTITSVTPADTGLYACTATNEVGSARSPSVEVGINVLKVMQITRPSFHADWFLKFIIPPLCVLFVAVLIFFICRLKMKRSSHQLRHEDAQISGKDFGEVQTSELTADNKANKFSYSMSNILFAGKDPSTTDMAEELPKGSFLQDTSPQAEHGQRKFGMYAFPKEKQSKETRSKGISEEVPAVYLSNAQVHFQAKRPCEWAEDNSDEENHQFSFSV
ncbi:sialoadhesin-like [Hippocampus comes]|uniref:sialoadhesin-like n=1 Tax=Hippocampus comes TaxID=109280 RepID=UPI00094EAAC3|nr:PREDICTED: sialoadhesin-like [Hippocampus comes]